MFLFWVIVILYHTVPTSIQFCLVMSMPFYYVFPGWCSNIHLYLSAFHLYGDSQKGILIFYPYIFQSPYTYVRHSIVSLWGFLKYIVALLICCDSEQWVNSCSHMIHVKQENCSIGIENKLL